MHTSRVRPVNDNKRWPLGATRLERATLLGCMSIVVCFPSLPMYFSLYLRHNQCTQALHLVYRDQNIAWCQQLEITKPVMVHSSGGRSGIVPVAPTLCNIAKDTASPRHALPKVSGRAICPIQIIATSKRAAAGCSSDCNISSNGGYLGRFVHGQYTAVATSVFVIYTPTPRFWGQH
jgi:hypothetical protein